ncbi:MAG: acid phosphatase type 7, partial [Thermomicrobiales bacterium]|nr:acid phosphatase type 7 [Thermomicrobiales bacterium]
LTTATYSGANTVSAPDVRLVTGSWAESSITWASKPAYGAIVAPGGTVWGVAAPYAWDVTSVISGNGTVSLALIGNSPDQVAANSREQTGAGTAAKPTLTVTTCGGAQPPTVTPTPTSGDGAVTLVAVGDIACKAGEVPSSTRCQHQATSDLAVQANPDTVLVLGDVQYECAATSDFAASYDSSWGRLKAVTRPVIGNHEYNWGDGRNPPCPEVAMPSGAEGYWSYFGAAANPLDPACRARCQGYYSFDVGAWHVVVLNSMLCTGAINNSNQCYVGSPQEKWLKNDLRNRANQCVLAAWHHPLFSTGERAPGTKPLWDALYAAGAEVMLTGHLHRYEQWAPQDGTGAATQFGLRQFIAGTGGKNFHTWNGSFPANLEVVNDRAFGVLRLILRGDGYAWLFLPAAGGQLTASGSAACHGAPPSAAGGESFLAAVPGDSVVWSVAALVGLLGAGRTRRRRGMVWAGIAACGVDPRGDPLFRCHAARRTSMRTLTRRIVAVWFAVSLALGGNRAVVAQDASPASEGIVAGVSAESLSIANLDVPTSGPGSIGFARTTLEPGGTVRLDATTGPSLHFVTEGTWTVRPAGDGAVSPATPASADGAPLEPDGEVVLDPGGRLLLPAGASVEVDNVGDVPAVSLSAEVTERMVAPDGNGVEWRPFGDPVAVPAGAMQVELTRLTLGRGATAAPHNTEGPELLDVRAGPVLLVLNPGQVRISRAEGGEENLSAGYDDPSITPEPDSAEGDDHEDGGMGADSAPPGTPLPGTAIGLRSGDAALLATGGTRVLRASDDAPAVILVVAVVPAGTAGTMPTPKSGS